MPSALANIDVGKPQTRTWMDGTSRSAQFTKSYRIQAHTFARVNKSQMVTVHALMDTKRTVAVLVVKLLEGTAKSIWTEVNG